jgi:hypothetical protein
LARNELLLLGATLVYCTLKLTLLRPNSEELERAVAGSLPDLDVQGLLDQATTLIYTTVMGVATLYQGGMALYYLRRKPDVERFHAELR